MILLERQLVMLGRLGRGGRLCGIEDSSVRSPSAGGGRISPSIRHRPGNGSSSTISSSDSVHHPPASDNSRETGFLLRTSDGRRAWSASVGILALGLMQFVLASGLCFLQFVLGPWLLERRIPFPVGVFSDLRRLDLWLSLAGVAVVSCVVEWMGADLVARMGRGGAFGAGGYLR